MSGFSGYGIQFIRYAGKIECGRDPGTLRSRCRAFFEFAERTGFDCRCGVVAGIDYRSRGASDAFGDGSAGRGLRGGKLYAQNAFETAGASLHAARPEPPDARPGRRTRFGLFGRVTAVQRDVREADLGECRYDIVLSGAALHHLRGDEEWLTVFARLYRSLRPGGCLMISDLVAQQTEVLSAYFRERYGDYLTVLGGTEYRDRVLAYVEREDSPRPLNYQLDLMREVGFREVEILHKNVCFAAYGGVR